MTKQAKQAEKAIDPCGLLRRLLRPRPPAVGGRGCLLFSVVTRPCSSCLSLIGDVGFRHKGPLLASESITQESNTPCEQD